ncbi:YecA family protein [Bacillus cereus]|uniref:YecA family protein n=1 Tax=Bacillus cereus TaxID=1396 RepID=UPI0015966414
MNEEHYRKVFKEINEKQQQRLEQSKESLLHILKTVKPLDFLEYITIYYYFNNQATGDNDLLPPSHLEHLCGLILSIDYDTTSVEEVTFEKIQDVIKTLEQFFDSWNFTNYSRRFNDNESEEEKEKKMTIAALAANYGIVRGDCYYEHAKEVCIGLFSPFDDWMKTNLGYNIKDAFYIIESLMDIISNSLNNFFVNLSSETEVKIKKIYEELEQKVEKNIANSSDFKLLRNLKNKNKKENLLLSEHLSLFEEKYKGVITFTIGDILSNENVNENTLKAFLDRFSCEINTTKNNNFNFPTDDNVFRERPIISHNNTYLVPNLMSIVWCLKDGIENDLKGTNIWGKYQAMKGNYLEDEAIKIFSSILPTATVFKSLYYHADDNQGETRRYELDTLLIYDSNLFLIESKSGTISTPARRGAFGRLKRTIQENIEYAFSQADRAKRYIYESEKPIFFDSNGKEVIRIDKENYTNIFLINVTLENFGLLATRLNTLQKIGVYKYQEYPWSVNINDLKIIRDFIEFPTQFIHYVHRRLKVDNKLENTSDISSADEIDLFAHYLETNLNYDNVQEYDCIFIDDYSSYFNSYYLGERDKEKIKQDMPPLFKQIILELESTGESGYTQIIIKLLEMDGKSRKDFEKFYNQVVNKTYEDRNIHDATMVFLNNPNDAESGFGITILAAEVPSLAVSQRLLGYSRLKKYQQKCFEWIGLAHYISFSKRHIDEFIYLREEESYDSEMEKLVEMSLKKIQEPINKVGRNSLCPCGSGQKYKRCHGKS